jgi:hypothetical protein
MPVSFGVHFHSYSTCEDSSGAVAIAVTATSSRRPIGSDQAVPSLKSVRPRAHCADAASPAEFAERLRRFAAKTPKGRWITGGDWDHERWGGELPRREWIDSFLVRGPKRLLLRAA